MSIYEIWKWNWNHCFSKNKRGKGATVRARVKFEFPAFYFMKNAGNSWCLTLPIYYLNFSLYSKHALSVNIIYIYQNFQLKRSNKIPILQRYRPVLLVSHLCHACVDVYQDLSLSRRPENKIIQQFKNRTQLPWSSVICDRVSKKIR